MFTRECLLRNVGEAKMHVIYELTKLGYSPMYMKFENNVGGSNVVCEGQTWHCTDSDNKPHCIDCDENIDLFLAIAALRDDTNNHQWFIAQDTMWDEDYNGEITVYFEEGEWLLWDYYSFMEDMPSYFRKATLEEIIKHFK